MPGREGSAGPRNAHCSTEGLWLAVMALARGKANQHLADGLLGYTLDVLLLKILLDHFAFRHRLRKPRRAPSGQPRGSAGNRAHFCGPETRKSSNRAGGASVVR